MIIISFVGCTLQYGLSYSGLNIIDGTSATLFVQAEIPFGILIAFFLLGERPPLKNIIGLIIAFIGIYILSGNPNLDGKMIGVIFILSAAFSLVFCTSFSKRCF